MFMSSDLLLDNIKRYCINNNIDGFSPRDFRRTFKTLAGKLKLQKRFVIEYSIMLYMTYHQSIIIDMIIVKKSWKLL